jgi:hypothetical protein
MLEKAHKAKDRARLRVLSPRPISIAHLNVLPRVQLRPINPVVFRGSYSLVDGKSYLEVGLALRCFQRLSRPDVATRRMPLAGQPVHRRSVLSY